MTTEEQAEKRAVIDGPIPLRDPALSTFFMLNSITTSGEPVNADTAKNYTAYFSGINLLASTIASMPILLQWDTKTGTNQNEEDNPFLHPNPNMTAFQFWEYLVWCMIGRGNAYVLIMRETDDNTSRITALWPLPPQQVEPKLDKKGNKFYVFTKENQGEVSTVFEDDQIMHIAGMGYENLKGKSIARLAQEAIGLGLSTERFGATFFGNNAVPGGIITHPTDLTNTAKQTLEREVEERLQGSKRSRRVIVLDEGMVYNAVGVSPEDGQFLQTRRFQVREICRWLRIPPHMLYDLDEATTGNIEQQSISFTTYSLIPWMTRITQAAEKSLIPKRKGYKSYYFWYDTSPLLLMDTATRLENYARGRNMGLLTLNDIRRKEKQPLLSPKQGDTYLVPSTMRVFSEDEPPPAIDPKIMADTIQLVCSIPNLTPAQVKAFVVGAMPTATEELVKACVASYKKNQEQKDDNEGIVPLAVATNKDSGLPDGKTGNEDGGGEGK